MSACHGEGLIILFANRPIDLQNCFLRALRMKQFKTKGNGFQ
jgi:hypothetical protein